jgi:hypothetical protein
LSGEPWRRLEIQNLNVGAARTATTTCGTIGRFVVGRKIVVACDRMAPVRIEPGSGAVGRLCIY